MISFKLTVGTDRVDGTSVRGVEISRDGKPFAGLYAGDGDLLELICDQPITTTLRYQFQILSILIRPDQPNEEIP